MSKVKNSILWRVALIVAVAVCVILLLLFLSDLLSARTDAESLQLAEQGIRRAAVQCYALEGFYPPSLDYLEEHYGVTHSNYFVDYQFVASNLMPDITVLPLSD